MSLEVSKELPVSPAAPALARRGLNRLAGVVPPGKLGELRIVVSEVVTNVLVHAGFSPQAERRMELRVVVGRRGLEAEVCDTGEGFAPPENPKPREDLSGGWGLFMLDKLSESWGVRREEGMFCVWWTFVW